MSFLGDMRKLHRVGTEAKKAGKPPKRVEVGLRHDIFGSTSTEYKGFSEATGVRIVQSGGRKAKVRRKKDTELDYSNRTRSTGHGSGGTYESESVGGNQDIEANESLFEADDDQHSINSYESAEGAASSHADEWADEVDQGYQQSYAGGQVSRKPVPSARSDTSGYRKRSARPMGSTARSRYAHSQAFAPVNEQEIDEEYDYDDEPQYNDVYAERQPGSVAASRHSRMSNSRTQSEVEGGNDRYRSDTEHGFDDRSSVSNSKHKQLVVRKAQSIVSGKSFGDKKSAPSSLTHQRLKNLQAQYTTDGYTADGYPVYKNVDHRLHGGSASLADTVLQTDSISQVGSSIAGSRHTRSSKGSVARNSDIESHNSRRCASPDAIDDQQYWERVNTQVSRKPSDSGNSQIGSDTGSRAGDARAGSVFSKKSGDSGYETSSVTSISNSSRAGNRAKTSQAESVLSSKNGGSGRAPSSVTSINNSSRTNSGTKSSQAGSVLGNDSGSKVIADINHVPPPASNVSGTSRTSTNTKTSHAKSESSNKSGGGRGSNINYAPSSVSSVSDSSRVTASTQASKRSNGTSKSSTASTAPSKAPSTILSSGSSSITTSSTKSKPTNTANGPKQAAPTGTTEGVSGTTKQNSRVQSAPAKPKVNRTLGMGMMKMSKERGGYVR
ncbi:hypothetical protein PMZ80_000369 [Knufia obscura]|uniref:Uncharacterized protein n=2 Tax=Knufia TaxID=430999 RepID=A0AAN8I6A3_9EURO|nr:hypothetical protein PMZ80_000369 [Knufia obscura]KAK5956702.1 hypothetical protein OHC33_002189 [Knufia fluminis]